MGTLVRSLAGRDRGDLFCVVGEEGQMLLLCDGKHRTLRAPKRKRAKHVQPVAVPDHPVLEKLRRHEPVTDHELRKALAAFRVQVRRL